jgi:hypothetical protein
MYNSVPQALLANAAAFNAAARRFARAFILAEMPGTE